MIIIRGGLAGNRIIASGNSGQAMVLVPTKEAAHAILVWNRLERKNLSGVRDR